MIIARFQDNPDLFGVLEFDEVLFIGTYNECYSTLIELLLEKLND